MEALPAWCARVAGKAGELQASSVTPTHSSSPLVWLLFAFLTRCVCVPVHMSAPYVCVGLAGGGAYVLVDAEWQVFPKCRGLILMYRHKP